MVLGVTHAESGNLHFHSVWLNCCVYKILTHQNLYNEVLAISELYCSG